MPIYEYQCKSCNEITEAIQKMSDPPLKKCECGGKLEKIMSQSSFQLKGTGWYETDYKSSNPAPARSTEKSDSAKSDAPKSEACATCPAAASN